MIFVDTSHLLALANRSDALHTRAVAWAERVSGPFVTTEYVLVEFLNSMRSAEGRPKAAAVVRALRQDPAIRVVPAGHDHFEAALALFEGRADQGWSLTDCASFVVMSNLAITDALTYDRHFEQAGFRALLRSDPA